MICVFRQICNMSQKKVKEYVTEQLMQTYKNVITGDGYVYAQGTFPVLLVAHMDTVHKKLPSVIVYDKDKKALSSPNGIGGDDRCGIYMVLEVIKKYNCSVLFTEDEEIGGIGAEKFTKAKFAKDLKFNYIIEFDRRGKDDAVFYDCDNPDFEEFITRDFYKTSWGSFSDISTIAPFLGCAAVNLSCGYYQAHTVKEYVVVPEMNKSIEEACKILERTTEKDVFEYIEAEHYNYKSYYDYYEQKYYIIEYVDKGGLHKFYDMYAHSKAEAIGKLWMLHNYLKYEDIIEVCSIEDYYY